MTWEITPVPCVVRWTDADGTHEERFADFADGGAAQARLLLAMGAGRVQVFRASDGALLSAGKLLSTQITRDFARKFGRRAA